MWREIMIDTGENCDYRIHPDIWQQRDILDHRIFAWIVSFYLDVSFWKYRYRVGATKFSSIA